MPRSTILAVIVAMLLGAWCPWEAPAQESQTAESRKYSQADLDGFIRVRKDGKKSPLALETSVTRFEGLGPGGSAVSVDLIGVVHVGEEGYYQQLNQLFTQYDVVLYELVAPEGTRIPKGGRVDEGLNPVAALQQGMKAVLELEFQLDHIDYMQENLLHADMTPEEFLESMTNNDESFGKMFLRAIGQSMAMQNSSGISNVDVLMTLMSNDPTIKIRRLMAEQMRNMEAGMVIFQGREGSTIIHHRNAKVVKVLKQQIDSGKEKIAIFYGAGHMPDIQERLQNELNMRRGGRTWHEAWSLRTR
jgi:hypothetical protein